MIVPTALIVATVVGFIAILAIDFFVVERRPHAFSTKEATAWVLIYISMALMFGALLFFMYDGEIAGQFIAGYLTEYSLSVDNLFVFMVILTSFAVPEIAQHRVLMFGVLFALFLRSIIIVVGVSALHVFEPVFILFGLFLFYTAWKVATEHEAEPKHIQDQFLVRLVSKVFPTHPEYSDRHATIRINGVRHLTPLALVMVAIGATDLMFALDSIPAVLGLTTEPFLVITSNAFALMGLRQLYFLLHGLIDRLVHLARGLAIILAFIAMKLTFMGVNAGFDTSLPDIPTLWSLAVIIGVLAVTTITSIRSTRNSDAAIRSTVEDSE